MQLDLFMENTLLCAHGQGYIVQDHTGMPHHYSMPAMVIKKHGHWAVSYWNKGQLHSYKGKPSLISYPHAQLSHMRWHHHGDYLADYSEKEQCLYILNNCSHDNCQNKQIGLLQQAGFFNFQTVDIQSEFIVIRIPLEYVQACMAIYINELSLPMTCIHTKAAPSRQKYPDDETLQSLHDEFQPTYSQKLFLTPTRTYLEDYAAWQKWWQHLVHTDYWFYTELKRIMT